MNLVSPSTMDVRAGRVHLRLRRLGPGAAVGGDWGEAAVSRLGRCARVDYGSRRMSTELTIAHITHQRFPNRLVGSRQVIKTVSALAGEGLDLLLVYPGRRRSLTISKSAEKYRLLEFYEIEEDDFAIAPLPVFPYSPAPLIKLSHGALAPLYASIVKRDIVYTRNTIATLVALGLRRRVIYEATRRYGEERADIIARLGRHTQNSDRLSIIAQSGPVRDSLVRAGADPGKVRVIRNGFDPGPFSDPLSRSEARRILGWPAEEEIVCYGGRVDVDKGARTILDLASRTPEARYLLVGYSEHEDDDWILTAAAERGLHNVTFQPWVPPRELAIYLFASDVLLVPTTAAPLRQYRHTVLPMKIFSYMAAGRCILAPALRGITDVLNEENAVLVEPDDPDLAAAVLRRLLDDESRRRSVAEQARIDSRDYTWQRRARKTVDFIHDRYERRTPDIFASPG